MPKFWIYTGISSLAEIRHHFCERLPNNQIWKKRVTAWGLASLFAFAFLMLFAMANPILEGWLKKFTDFLFNLEVSFDAVLRVGHFILLTLFVWGLMRYRLFKQVDDGTLKEPPALPVIFTDACLVVFNIVFGLQSVLDIGCLFSGMNLPDGMTYAEYAHRGFYPLWIASMLAGGFMLLFWSDDPRKYPPSRVRDVFLGCWMFQNLLLLLSAIYRMNLYVATYSLTRLRLAAFIGMILVLVGLCSIAVRVARRKSIGWLLNVNGCSIVAVLLVVALVNVPARISWFNVKHSKEYTGDGVPLDIGYLIKLGPDALPSLIGYTERATDKTNDYYVKNGINNLVRKFNHSSNNWRGWNLSRHRIAKLINDLPDELQQQKKTDKRPRKFDREKYRIIR